MLTIESAIAYSDYIDALKSLTSVAKMPYRRAIITTYFILYIVRRNIRRSLFTILFIDYRMVAFPLWLQTIKRFKNAFVKLLAKYRSLITREIRMRAGANQNHWRITYWIRLGAVGQSNPNRQRSVTMEIAKLRYTIGGDSSAVDWLVGWWSLRAESDPAATLNADWQSNCFSITILLQIGNRNSFLLHERRRQPDVYNAVREPAADLYE